MGHYVSADSSFISKLVITFFLLLAGYEIYFGLTQWFQGYMTNNWQGVTGNVVSSQSILSPNLAYGGRTTQAVQTAYPKIYYKYTVNDATYQGNRVQFGLQFSQRGILAKYAAGNTVTVYYQATDPTQAVLIKGWSYLGVLYTMALVIFFVVVALFILAVEKF